MDAREISHAVCTATFMSRSTIHFVIQAILGVLAETRQKFRQRNDREHSIRNKPNDIVNNPKNWAVDKYHYLQPATPTGFAKR